MLMLQLLDPRRVPRGRESGRAKLSGTWALLLMLTVPLTVIFFFCIINYSFINLHSNLIKGVFFNNCVLHARHHCGATIGYCSFSVQVAECGLSELQAPPE